MFTPARTERALYVPPIANYTFLRSAAAWERVGARFFPTFSGVVMIESGKQLYASSAKPAKQRRFARPVVVSLPQAAGPLHRDGARDRKSVVQGKSVSVRVDLGGRRIIKKTKKHKNK